MKQTKINISNNIKLLFNKCLKQYNILSEKNTIENNDIKKIEKTLRFLESFYSFKIKFNDFIVKKEQMNIINFVEKYKKEISKKNIELEEYLNNLEIIFKYLIKYTGCNILLYDIKIPNITCEELFYVLNSYSPVLNIYKIMNDVYLIELYSAEIAKELALEYDKQLLTTNNNEEHTIRCNYIDNKIENIIIVNNIRYYINLYNKQSYNLINILKQCSYKKLIYDRS